MRRCGLGCCCLGVVLASMVESLSVGRGASIVERAREELSGLQQREMVFGLIDFVGELLGSS